MDDPGANVRWDLIERLARHYAGGQWDPEDHADAKSLSEDELEVLQWKMEEGDSAVILILRAMKVEGVSRLADLGGKPREG